VHEQQLCLVVWGTSLINCNRSRASLSILIGSSLLSFLTPADPHWPLFFFCGGRIFGTRYLFLDFLCGECFFHCPHSFSFFFFVIIRPTPICRNTFWSEQYTDTPSQTHLGDAHHSHMEYLRQELPQCLQQELAKRAYQRNF